AANPSLETHKTGRRKAGLPRFAKKKQTNKSLNCINFLFCRVATAPDVNHTAAALGPPFPLAGKGKGWGSRCILDRRDCGHDPPPSILAPQKGGESATA